MKQFPAEKCLLNTVQDLYINRKNTYILLVLATGKTNQNKEQKTKIYTKQQSLSVECFSSNWWKITNRNVKFNKKISIHKNIETGYIILKQRKAKLLHNTYQSRWSGKIFIIKKNPTNNVNK